MATYEVGQTIYATYYNRDSTGALVDTGALPTLTVTLPDLTTTSGNVSKTATGTYLGSLAATSLSGRYRLAFSGGTSNNAGLPWSDVADVWASNPRLLIPLADAKAACNIAASITTNDDELRLYIATATEVIENYTGPILQDGHSRTVNGQGLGNALLLPEKPTAITSITENGYTLDTTTYTVDYNAGIVYRGGPYTPMNWRPGFQNITVTYTVGNAVVPPNVTLAARELVRIYYQGTQQGGRPAFGDTGTDPTLVFTPSGYGIPPLVETLLSAAESQQVAWFG